MPNPLTDRFSGLDLPPGVPAQAMGALSAAPARPTPTPAATAPTVTPMPSLAERAATNLKRAMDGISALLGRPVTAPSRAQQLEAQLDALQKRSTPNILSTIPRLAPIATPPPEPVGTPKPAATPFSMDGWLAAQNSKGT